MADGRRLRDLGLSVGDLPVGASNTIVDVPGVRVGHCEVRGEAGPGAGPVCTGVTVIVPGSGNPFRQPLPAAVDVFNGHTKSAGLAQIEELGRLETPIYLTSTLCVGRVWDAAMSIHLQANPEAVTGNMAVFECNDAGLNDARGRHVTEEHVRAAYRAASASPPALGSVGAGSGTRLFGYRGGIGSSSRLVRTQSAGMLAVGVLSFNNFGGRLAWRGRAIEPARPAGQDAGSVIIVIATDGPLGPNLLRRLARRSWAGVGRVGSRFGHGSGDVAIAFALPSPDGTCPESLRWRLAEGDINRLFDAVADATEESIWDCLLLADKGRAADGTVIPALGGDDLLRAANGPEAGQ